MNTTAALRTGCLTLSCVVLACSSLAPEALAVCDLPLEIQQNGILPNVLFMVDSSVSMREPIFHQAYDPETTYAGPFETITAYFVSEDGFYQPSSWNSSFPTSPSVFLVASEGNFSGRYLGNYLNWIFFHATQEQRDGLPRVTRIEVAKAAIITLINQVEGVRIAVMKFNGSSGGNLTAGVNVSRNALISNVESIHADAWTPAAEAMVDAYEFFSRDSSSAPIQFECQKSVIIFISDGYPTQDLDVPSWVGDQDGDGREPGTCESIGAPEPNSANCSDYVDDVAYYLAHNDARPDLPDDQIVYTHTIALGVEVPILRDVAENGLGTYQHAWDLQSLLNGLERVIATFVEGSAAGSSVAVVSTRTETAGHLYRATFLPGAWNGYLEAYRVAANGVEALQWEAGELLANRTADSRTILTRQNGATVDFVPDRAADLAAALGAADTVQAQKLIRFVRGEDIASYRDRDGWKLGDIVHSAPLVVGGPLEFHMDAAYQEFLATNADREPVIYVGANDGMLHAFLASTGQELWAYIPENVLGRLGSLADPAYCHESYVDLSPVAYEIKTNAGWRTVLFGGLRNGGSAYFAIDISDPYAPEVLWETDIPELVKSYATPAVVRRPTGTYLWLGSGPDPGGFATVALLDATTGSVTFTAAVGTAHTETNLAGSASVYDQNWDGWTDFVYHGDMAGNLWRWNVQGASPDAWVGERLFVANGPIQARPALSVSADGQLLVYFGTGRYLESGDALNLDENYFYCVRDDGFVTNLTSTSLTNQTLSIDDVSTSRGWWMALTQAPGERVVYPAKVVDGVLYFTSFSPTYEECVGGGRSWLYQVDYRNGATPSSEDDASGRVQEAGEGVATAPVIYLEDPVVLVHTSDARVSVFDAQIDPKPIVVHSWREKFEGLQAEGSQ